MTMRGARIRHLPVVTEEGILIGIITDRDVRLAAASDAPSMAQYELPSLLEKLRVRDIMTPEVVTVHGTTSDVEAGLIFLEKKVGCLPVVRDNNRLEGIITVADLLRAYSKQGNAAWLMGIASKKRLMHFRSRGSKPEVPLDVALTYPSPEPSTDRAASQRLEIESISRALLQLSPDRAEALILTYFGGLSYAETGRVLKKSEAAIKMLVSRGLQDLRERTSLALEVE